MKANLSVDSALKRYLAAAHPLLREKALAQLTLVLEHPGQISESLLLTQDHPLKREALLISDGLEAVTNGMQDQDVEEFLSPISPASVFNSWKHLVLALYGFYHGQADKMREHTVAIQADSPPGRLSPLLESLGREKGPQGLRPRESEAYEELLMTEESPQQTMDQMLEALQTGMDDLFFQLLDETLLIFENDWDSQQKIGHWAVKQLEFYELDGNQLLAVLENTLGKKEASRIMALGLKASDLETSLLFWMQYMIWSQEGSTEPQVLTVHWEIFYSWRSEVETFQGTMGRNPDFEVSFEALLKRLEKPESESTADRGGIPAIRSSSLNSAQPIQLDLFAS